MIHLTNKIYSNVKKTITENWRLFLALIGVAFLFCYDTSYVVYTPGGYIDLSDRIEVTNGNNTVGSLGMAYVSMIKGNLFFVGLSYLNKNWDLVSKNDITYDNETMKIAEKREKISMEEAVSNAKIAAFKLANKSYNILNTKHIITYLDNQDTTLEVFDEVKRVDGIDIVDIANIRELVSKKDVGDYINLEVIRDEKLINATAKIQEVNGNKLVGIAFTNVNEVETDPEVNVKVKDNESGPSGGLMMSLGIYNSLVSEDITKGKKIIGTGTIDSEGNVGEIGGVKYKLIGAVKNKAAVFLCPRANYEEAIRVAQSYNYDIMVIAVDTLEGAIEELAKL